MTQLRQADIARATGLSEMTISRAVAAIGRRGEPLDEDTALHLLTADELTRVGLAWPAALQLVGAFPDEVLFLAFDPTVRRTWILFVETGEASFNMAAASLNHLASLLDARPLTTVLALHRPVEGALERLYELKRAKEVA